MPVSDTANAYAHVVACGATTSNRVQSCAERSRRPRCARSGQGCVSRQPAVFGAVDDTLTSQFMRMAVGAVAGGDNGCVGVSAQDERRQPTGSKFALATAGLPKIIGR